MPLPVPYFVYGAISSNSGSYLSGASVIASGNSSASYGTDTAGTSGQYQINLQDYCSSGDTIRVTSTYSGDSSTDTFTFQIGDLPKRLDLAITITVSPAGGRFSNTGIPVKINKVPGKSFWIG
jgi:VCBS repeat-containing protein